MTFIAVGFAVIIIALLVVIDERDKTIKALSDANEKLNRSRDV